MESPFLQPGFLITAISLLVGAIFWLARLESKTTTNSERNSELNADLDSLQDKFEAHRLNADVHFNRDFARKVDDNNQAQFKKIDAELSEIKADVKALLRKQ